MKQRIASVDILRGFTIVAMILVNTPGDWNHIYPPLSHAKWHGLTPTDVIFPFFLFIVGISIYFAYKNKTSKRVTYKKIVIRSLKLIGLGLFLNLFTPYFPFFEDLGTVRIPGVLQRIGVVFFISAILYLNFNWKILLRISLFILVSYWLFLGYMPFPNLEGISPTFDRAPNNWANYIDLQVLGKHMWQPDYDPEGIISTIPATISCLSGILVARLIDKLKHLGLLVITALSFLILGYIFDLWFPINKAIWSSSFVLVTSGWATLILAIIYYCIDVKNLKFGTLFKHVGMNAITIYFLSIFITKIFYSIKVNNHGNIHTYIYESIFTNALITDKLASLLYALVIVTFYVTLAYILYKKNIFIKV